MLGWSATYWVKLHHGRNQALRWVLAIPRILVVPIPTETDEEARRAHREREDLTSERLSILTELIAF
jgi:hypothetical protein